MQDDIADGSRTAVVALFGDGNFATRKDVSNVANLAAAGRFGVRKL